jgi:DNA-binding response OmpR family regulator
LEALELLRTVLEADGHQVTAAVDGRQALRLGESEKYDLYILDVTMPFLDGYHVAEKISDKYPDQKILLLTSRDYDRDKMAVESCGADAHMTKPYDVNELLRTVKDLLSG